ncbi:MAG: amidohydrolase family protein [Alphaproteobacteria bacterium]|nr:amidohydrolase family protein [Alphaproteobacteria bacterium]
MLVAIGVTIGIFSGEAVAKKSDTWIIIHAGTLMADARKPPRSRQSIVIKNRKIFDIRNGYISAADVAGAEKVKIIELKNRFVMAGMIDSHTHVTEQMTAHAREKAVTTTESEYALIGSVYARRILNAGFTTIRNVGGPREAVFAIRNSIRKDQILGPRIVASGYIISPLGGHGDTNGFRPDVFGTPNSGICNGADDCRRAVRDQIKYGADMIKYVATGGVLSKIATGTGQQFTDAEQAAIVQTAHMMGRKVAAHAHGKAGIEAALRAGVDSIEHGSYLDEGTVKLFRKTGAYLVPTLLAGKTVVDIATNKPGFFLPEVAAKAKRVGPIMAHALNIAYKGGVKIAFGTDSGVSVHGINGQELVLMVKAGMSRKDVLIAATVSAADLLGLSDSIGTLAKGKSADIIAARANPLTDISTLLKPDFVMVRGVVAVK